MHISAYNFYEEVNILNNLDQNFLKTFSSFKKKHEKELEKKIVRIKTHI